MASKLVTEKRRGKKVKDKIRKRKRKKKKKKGKGKVINERKRK